MLGWYRLKFRETLMIKILLILIIALNLTVTGCTSISQARKTDTEDFSRLQEELSELERAKSQLEERLKNEILQNQVKVEMLERGLVITFVAEVLFDSGKDQLRPASLETLEKISSVLKTTVKDLSIGIEGHTDNIPIKHSGWKSNWELSAARALSVLHYLIDSQAIKPQRLSATGYGEYHPIISNDAPESRKKNRRVEIVILPKISKAKLVPPEKIVIQKNFETQTGSPLPVSETSDENLK